LSNTYLHCVEIYSKSIRISNCGNLSQCKSSEKHHIIH